MDKALLSASPEELKIRFLALTDRQSVAKLLEITDYHLRYHLYLPATKTHYQKFVIPKKNGQHREILAPASAIKIIQQKLSYILSVVYQPKPSVHGFTNGRSIVSNAQPHVGKKFVMNLDIENFFPSINFGRVRGLFMGKPYSLNDSVATVLAQICCYENHLPQGAPTSPIVANMICAKLDSQLQKLAKKCRCTYTRYADDITFSTTLNRFPSILAVHDKQTDQIHIGPELETIFNENGFALNAQKVRLLKHNSHQEVTGLTVNKKINIKRSYVRQVRAMLHNWQEKGIAVAEQDFWGKYNSKYRRRNREKPSYAKVVAGKIEYLGMIRGKDDYMYIRLLKQLQQLDPRLVKSSRIKNVSESAINILIGTEGKTDVKHLKAALKFFNQEGRFTNLNLEFQGENSDSELISSCKNFSKHSREKPFIGVFDRDVPDTIKQVTDPISDFKSWGNKVFSFVLPIPNHRDTDVALSIELYYHDEDIKRYDINNRRLFLSNEFNPRTSRHLTDKDLIFPDMHKIKGLKIIDSRVYDFNEINVALSKDDFASNILDCKDGFDGVNFSEFAKIFDMMISIIERSAKNS